MTYTKSATASIIVTIILGTMGCMILGALLIGPRIFNMYQTVFQFVGTALVASTVFAFMRYSSVRNAFLILVLFFVFKEAIERNFHLFQIYKNILYFALTGLTVYIYAELILPKVENLKFGKFLIFTSLFTIVQFFWFLIHIPELIAGNPVGITIESSLSEISFNFLVGLGIGLGLDAAQIVTSLKIFRVKSQDLPLSGETDIQSNAL